MALTVLLVYVVNVSLLLLLLLLLLQCCCHQQSVSHVSLGEKKRDSIFIEIRVQQGYNIGTPVKSNLNCHNMCKSVTIIDLCG